MLHGLSLLFYYQKKDNSLGESSISDKSSAVKSNSTLSTPQGEGTNFHTESKLSEGSPLADQRIEPGEDIESLEDSSHEIETPEVHKFFLTADTSNWFLELSLEQEIHDL